MCKRCFVFHRIFGGTRCSCLPFLSCTACFCLFMITNCQATYSYPNSPVLAMAISCSGGCSPWWEEGAEAWQGWIGWRWGNAEPGAWRCRDGDTSCQPPSLASANAQNGWGCTRLWVAEMDLHVPGFHISVREILSDTSLRNKTDIWPSPILSHNFLYFFVFLAFRAGGKNYTGGEKVVRAHI